MPKIIARNLLKEFLKLLFNKFGYQVLLKPELSRMGYDYEDEAATAIKKVRLNTMLSHVKLLSLYQQVVFCEKNHIQGSYVECGVWKGGSVGLMALANLKYGAERRQIHLFDSFSEICEPDASIDGDRAVQEVRQWSKNGDVLGRLKPLDGMYDKFGGPGTLEENKKLLETIIGYDSDKLYYHKGWFQETLPVAAPTIQKIAILRLDGDWYASTKVCLEHLFDKVVSGGFIIIDDYAAYEGCKKAVDEFFESRNLIVYLHQIDGELRYLIKT